MTVVKRVITIGAITGAVAGTGIATASEIGMTTPAVATTAPVMNVAVTEQGS